MLSTEQPALKSFFLKNFVPIDHDYGSGEYQKSLVKAL